MSYIVNNTVVADTTGIRVSNYTTAGRPASPVQGQVIYNTTKTKMEIWDGTVWKELDQGSRPFLYRTIITTSYVMGGYKDTSPWRNVNRMAHSADVCTNLGDQLSRPAAYTSGVCNLTKGFLWATDTAWPGTNTITSGFNMATETSAGLNSNWDLRVARNDCATVWKETQFAYIIAGGDARVDVFNLTNETMYQLGVGGNSLTGGAEFSGAASFCDEMAGYVWDNTANKILFSTEVAYTVASSSVAGNNSQQKGISSKVGRGWAGNEGTYNGGYNLRRWQFSNDTNLGTVSKPIGDSGEENLDMGQAHQYLLGMYDGTQNNRGWKFNYSTEAGFELGAGSVRTGVPGGSSGHCVWKG
jgi:hypothetical protein